MQQAIGSFKTGMKSMSMSPGRYVGVAEAGLWGRSRPQTKIFRHRVGVILNQWDGG